MHLCLRIHEILSLVILEVAGTPGDEAQDNPGLASLAAMARTCRTFHDPAMDRLWLYLYNIDHLLALLPELSDGDAATSRKVRKYWKKQATLWLIAMRSSSSFLHRACMILRLV